MTIKDNSKQENHLKTTSAFCSPAKTQVTKKGPFFKKNELKFATKSKNKAIKSRLRYKSRTPNTR